MEIHPPLLCKQRDAASRWEDCQVCVSASKSSYYVKAAVSYDSHSLATLCVSCFFLSTISNSSRSLSSSKLCHQAGNGGSQNFLRVSVHALLNQWPSGQSEVLLLVMEPQIESLSEGNHRSGCKRKKCCRKQSKDIISASLNILPARFCEPLTPACHANHIWDDAPTSRDGSNNILPVLLLFFPPLLLTPQRGYKHNTRPRCECEMVLPVWQQRVCRGEATACIFCVLIQKNWGASQRCVRIPGADRRGGIIWNYGEASLFGGSGNRVVVLAIMVTHQFPLREALYAAPSTKTELWTKKNKRLWWQRTGTARQQRHFFSKAVMRIYHILTALLHFFSPSLRIIKRVFLINNKCSKQPSVQLREIR